METTGNLNTTVKCLQCGWERPVLRNENPANGLRYHLIQVHNDQRAVRGGNF